MASKKATPAKKTVHVSIYSSSIVTVISVLVVVIGIYLAVVPQPKLDWENTVLPMANKFVDNKDISETPLNGLTVVISGSTSGIGYGLTKAFVKLGAKVIAIGRSEDKLDSLKEELGSNNLIETVLADYHDLQMVSDAADEISKLTNKVDILINNAGIHQGMDMFGSDSKSVQGFDTIFSVNYLGGFVLTEKLIPLLQNSDHKPTVVQMSSSFHWVGNYGELLPVHNKDGTIDPPVSSKPMGAFAYFVWRTQRGYGNSKLAQILNTRALQRHKTKLFPTSVTTEDGQQKTKHPPRFISVCPAWVGTSIAASPGTLGHTIFKALAFPLDGHGIASTLYGIFYPTENTNNPNGQGYEDYFSNSRLLNVVTVPKEFTIFNSPLTFIFGLRDFGSWLLGFNVLLLQRLLPINEPMISAPITYDANVVDEFYNWTLQAVSEFL